MEAMSLGRPVVSTFVAGIPELVLEGQCGWLAPAGDVDRLAAALKHCLLTDGPGLARLGQAARERAIARHDIDVQAKDLVALFNAGESNSSAHLR
jgi:colanic acid/amylovoran biosynthesis glycosyltransferase